MDTDNHSSNLGFKFDNTFARELEGFFVSSKAALSSKPRLLQLNYGLVEELGLDVTRLLSDSAVKVFAGNHVPDGATPLAQVYAGHQFGGFSPQLGDGRALLLGEVIDQNQNRRDIQLKGSGRTPFSRGGDGRAALGPVLREYIIGEAMYSFGIPTTRALAAVSTGDIVHRETELPGAVLTRVAASHIRVGTFQFFAARGQQEKVKQLADYCIDRHYPDVKDSGNPYLEFFKAVVKTQAYLIARWMSVGFIHGVMNTDNMTISGETIDYGPCAFMDTFVADTVFSSIDTHGRYAYSNQPDIAAWNLARFAETLVPLIDQDSERAVEILLTEVKRFSDIYSDYWVLEMRNKLGLTNFQSSDLPLITDFLTMLSELSVDYTQSFRALSESILGDHSRLDRLFQEEALFVTWYARWKSTLERKSHDLEAQGLIMNSVNPLYIPRNHIVEHVIHEAVELDNLVPFTELLDVLRDPFKKIDGSELFEMPAPPSLTPYQTFCGT